MALTGTVTGKLLDVDGSALTGTVTFRLGPAMVSHTTDNSTYVRTDTGKTVTLDSSGAFSVTLPATNDPELGDGSAWLYEVKLDVHDKGGNRAKDPRPFAIEVPASTVVDLSDVAPQTFIAGKPVSFIAGEQGPAGQDALGTEPQQQTLADWLNDPAANPFKTAHRDTVSEVGPAVTTDHGFASLQAVVDAAQVGGVVEVRRAWSVAAPVNVSKALTIRTVRGVSVTTSGDVHAFNVTADDVKIHARLIGYGSGVAGTQAAVYAKGTLAAPIHGLEVSHSKITGFSKYAVEGWHVHDYKVERNHIEDIAYAAVMILSGKGRTIFNTIKNIVQPTGFTNSYGVTLTRDSTQTLTDAPRSTGNIVYGNLVDGVPLWEGIDTHAGDDNIITNNIVRNTKVGIALVPGKGTGGTDAYAPRGNIVQGNTIDSTVSDGSRHHGIQVIGAVADVDTVLEYADAVVSGNIVNGHGTQSSTASGGIFIQATRGTVVKGNTLIESSPVAVTVDHNNKGAIVEGNTCVDTWTTDAAFTACVYIRSVHNTVTVSGNNAVAAGKTATKVNDRGLYMGSSLTHPDVEIQYDGNNFKACAIPLVDSPSTQNITEHRAEARKVSFYPGITPVTRATVSAAATDTATTQALVNELREKLIALGLVQ